MNTLRKLSVVCRALRIKQLIGLLILLLVWPAFVSANCSPAQTCVVTSGTALVTVPCPNNIRAGDCAPFNFAGTGFSASGLVLDAEGTGNLPFPPRTFGFDSDPFEEFFGGTVTEKVLAQVQLTVNGVPWGIPAGGDAGVSFSADLGILAPDGTYSRPFSFSFLFKGAPEPFAPGLGCDVLNCETLNFSGGGIVTYDVNGLPPNLFEVDPPQTFTFALVPEPATLCLLALGLVGLVARRKAIGPLLAAGNAAHARAGRTAS